jgi:FtsP/CotA-like multicopper oxidase with cupredoxin domain
MMNRRKLVNLGLWGSASTLLSSSALRAATGSTLRPVLTPFLDRLPLPPSPLAIDWAPNQLPFNDLDTEARRYVDPTQVRGKATFYRIVSEVRKVSFHSHLPDTEIWGYRDDHPSLANKPWTYAFGPSFSRPFSNHNEFVGTIVRHVNKLPSVQEHRGFGEPRNSAHLHGGHQPSRFDGYPTDLTRPDGTVEKRTFERGEHFDYAYPLVDPGFFNDGLGSHTERASTMWYHDHIIDFTSQNVYRGLVGLFEVHDNPVLEPLSVDRNRNELIPHTRDIDDETKAPTAEFPFLLQLPSGAFDVPLVLQEKTFGLNGELIYDVFNTDGYMGDKYLVNGMVQPFLPVKRRKYRFRFLNGSNARIYQLFLCDKNGRSYPMTQIATEGGLLSRPVVRPSLLLGMAERIEVVIDFNQFKYPDFSEMYIENRMLQDDGRGPNGTFEKPELASRGAQLIKFKLEEVVYDPSRVGIDRGNGLELRPFTAIPAQELARAAANIRTFEFGRQNGQWAINGQLAGDLSRVVARPQLSVGEIWRLKNGGGGWWHPIHIHHEFMRVLKRNGKLPFDGTGPDFGQSLERDGLARKDTIVLGPNSEVDVYVKFDNYKGPFVFHCHNIEHEDHQMMARFDVI